ncbi:Hcp family type VI secretion system effector [Rahnella sikkimica]|uniref:Type VI secretion system protein n=1 Tax=Rahnella sikkimica TaxID=1805933 RepID=A0A2L1UVH4_9GAMM|nr:Hcp family type VI secretion system effector [Rahnella sikkimica]AVF36953.1 type VI secretion system protein [Rahnella sikkimica]
MANLIYLTLNGQTQGLISAGCSSLDSIGNKAQIAHLDQIMVYELSHMIAREQNTSHQPIIIQKPIDKSSPLLGKAIYENELLTCIFDFYRTNRFGVSELYYKIKLTEASIKNIRLHSPNALRESGGQPVEIIGINYKSITWEHIPGGTSAYSFWEDRVF